MRELTKTRTMKVNPDHPHTTSPKYLDVSEFGLRNRTFLEPSSSKPETARDEIEKENQVLKKAEEKLEELKTKSAEKEIIFHKILLEIKRMVYIFNKVKDIDVHTTGKEFNEVPKVSLLATKTK